MPKNRLPAHLRFASYVLPWMPPRLFEALVSDDWAPDAEDADSESPVAYTDEDAHEAIEVDGWAPEIIDLRSEAKGATYRHNKKRKFGYYRKRKAGCSKVLTVHQTGVEREVGSTRYHLITAHYAIRSDGALLWLFDHDQRLMSSNALDRAPYHAINVEVCGNFEGLDGSGRWWKPEIMGRGRANPAQLRTLCWLIRYLREKEGIEIVAPHRVSGRNRKGIPNRPICPGSRVWQCAESFALREGLTVPDGDDHMGGEPIPLEWRSALWLERQRAA